MDFRLTHRIVCCVLPFALALCVSGTGWAQQNHAHVPDAPVPAVSLQAVLTNPQTSEGVSEAVASPEKQSSAATVSLYTVVDLALKNSRAVQIAEAEQQSAIGSNKEIRDAYIPNFALGSGLGYSYGFPLGTPNIFNVTSTSLLFSFSQRDYMRSARAGEKAAALRLKDVREQVILDASLNYLDLAKTTTQIEALHQSTADADALLAIMNDRLQAGLETNIQMTRARLTRAQIVLRAIQMEDHAEELRQHLADLTQLDASVLEPVLSSVPALPDLDFPGLLRAGPKPASVLAAEATADSKLYAAWGDKRQNYRPAVNFVMQYQRFSTFNGYQNYYKFPPGQGFPLNNFGVGIQAVWPLFDPVRGDKAAESKAEAERARRQAELARIQSDEGNLALWHSLRELEAQEQVATFQQQLAQDTLEATETQMNASATPANGVPVAPQQAEQDRIEERTSYVDLRDAQFNVSKVKLNLLRAVGELEDWIKQSGAPARP